VKIPFVDLGAQYQSIKPAIDAAIQSVIDDCAFVGGKPVERFARQFAEAYGVDSCIPVANGTDAIYIALRMLGIGPGDEVITSAASWIATSEVITQTGARPVFVDIDAYHHLDQERLEAAVTPSTKAIIPVHLFGQPACMGSIVSIAEKYGLAIVEDCAQAHFATISGKNVGTLGSIGTFSFYPGKNLGAYGDAGAIVTNDPELATKCKMFANHGSLTKHDHQMEGINSRLDGLQAAVLSVKLPLLAEWTRQRQTIAALYDELLVDIPEVRIPLRREDTTHVFHLYVIRAQARDQLCAFLRANGIGVGIHYPTPLPLLPAYRYLNHTEDEFSEAAAASREILSLPMYPEMTDEMVGFVVGKIRDFYRELGEQRREE
jgi:dTDP-4-amino-4,6-dideoxygalactose transaminase